MNSFRIPLTLLLLAAGTMVCGALTLKELEASYESKCSEITLEKDKSLKSLRDGYITALGRIEAKYRKAGNLDAVLLVKEEAILIEGGKWPLPALPEKISMEANSPRKIFLRNYLKIEQDAAKDLVDTADKMLALLESQVVELTKSGDITEAQLAQQISNDIVKDAEITGARKLVNNVRSDGSSRPVLRIRRYGDNIEALVSYDMRGKVSMDSPIRNVVESDKSIGDTKAKVLGEFVGAKGYETDAYAVMRKTFEDGELGNIVPKQIESEITKQYEGIAGLRLNIQPAATNPYVSVPVAIAPQSVGGTNRVTVRYFIPRSNKVITGFQFNHGPGAAFGGHIFRKAGKWERETATSESTDESQGLLLYLRTKPGEKGGDPSSDPVVLGEIKVEQISFTSYIIQRLGEANVILEKFKDPAKQPVFTRNGELIPQPEP